MGIEMPDIPTDEYENLVESEGTPEALEETSEASGGDDLVSLLDQELSDQDDSGVVPEAKVEAETPPAVDHRYEEMKRQNDWFRQQLEHAMAQRQQHQAGPAPTQKPQHPSAPEFLRRIADGESVDPRIIEAQWNYALQSAVTPLRQQVSQMVSQQQQAAQRADAESRLNAMVKTAQEAYPNTPREYLLGRIVNADPNQNFDVTQYAREFSERVDAEITRRGGTVQQTAEQGSRKKVPRARRSGSGKSNESSEKSTGKGLQDIHDRLLRAVGKK